MGRIEYKNYDRFLLAVDCIIFGFDGSGLKALLIKRGLEPEIGKWSLMGGFAEKEESVDSAAQRILYKLTGLEKIYMEQLHCFGDVGRDANTASAPFNCQGSLYGSNSISLA